MLTLFRIFCSMFIMINSHGKRFVFPAAQFKDTRLRILDGRDIRPDEYTFVISLIDFDYNMLRVCTGSMVTEYWGLTAAHCSSLGLPYYVWFANFTDSPIRSHLVAEVLETFIHPSFRVIDIDDWLVNNDISLFYSLKVNVKSFARLSSVDHTTMIGLPVTYVGSGWTEKLGASKRDIVRLMQVGEGAVIKCSAEMKNKSKYLICITPKCSSRLERPWHGDSGGPLIHDNRIIGICSFGIKSDVMSQSGFTPISPYINWIYQVMHSRDKH